jgi:hypothetical protein
MGGTGGNIWFGGRANWLKKLVDDGNLTYFIIRYRYRLYLDCNLGILVYKPVKI